MKRAFQIVGILLVLLLAAGPASAALGCTLSGPAMDSSCPMDMDGMSADCPMSHALATVDCSHDCCDRTAPIALVVNGIPVKSKFVASIPQISSLTVPSEAEENSHFEGLPSFAASSPPRYILLRVFRI